MKSYTIHVDPGHGWLAVDRSELAELGILDKITSFSYQSRSGRICYLEEDCDMATFLIAKNGGLKPDTDEKWQSVCHIESRYHDDNRIRGLPSYKATAAERTKRHDPMQHGFDIDSLFYGA